MHQATMRGIEWNKRVVVKAFAVSIGVWGVYGIGLGLQSYFNATQWNDHRTFLEIVGFSILTLQCHAWLSPGICFVASRYPLIGKDFPRIISIHAITFCLYAFLYVSIRLTVMPPLDPVHHVWLSRTFAAAKEAFQTNIFPLFSTYILIVAISSWIEYYFLQQKLKFAENEMSRVLLQRSWQVLKLQLQPHFLFNTLQSISELAIADPIAAQRTISRLSELLRTSLDDELPDVVPFTRELDFLTAYLDIEKIRFGKRLSVSLDMEPPALDAGVPSLLLQPIVENAIRHGIAKRAAGGQIHISAQVLDRRFHLSVRDTAADGPRGRGVSQRADGFGIGLRNTEDRLRHLYKDDFTLRLVVHELEACVDIDIPYTRMAKTDSAIGEVMHYDKV